jgi:SAM-dependent methyltransferase
VKLRQFFFSRLLERASRIHEPLVASRKARLFAGVSGAVLEIGPGAGVNFRYFPQGIDWTGYEPNPHLARQIPLPLGARLHEEPFTAAEPERYDFAITTLVLCSVDDVRGVLDSLRRALKPGGKLLYIEHVAAGQGTRLRRAQDFWLPLWRCAADGCHPNRETARLIREAGFSVETEESFTLPLWLAGPHVCGVAQK